MKSNRTSSTLFRRYRNSGILAALTCVSSAFAFSWNTDHLQHLARGYLQPQHSAEMTMALAPFVDTTTGEHEGTLVSRLFVERHRGSMSYSRRNVGETQPHRWSFYSEIIDTLVVNGVPVTSHVRVSGNHLSGQATVVTTPFHPVYPGKFQTDCQRLDSSQTVEDRMTTSGNSTWSLVVNHQGVWPVHHQYNGLKLDMDLYYRQVPLGCGSGNTPDIQVAPLSVLVPWNGSVRLPIAQDQYQAVMLSNRAADLWVP